MTGDDPRVRPGVVGDRYRARCVDDCIELVPIPDDPAAALGDAANNKIREAPFDELRATAIEEGRDQALE